MEDHWYFQIVEINFQIGLLFVQNICAILGLHFQAIEKLLLIYCVCTAIYLDFFCESFVNLANQLITKRATFMILVLSSKRSVFCWLTRSHFLCQRLEIRVNCKRNSMLLIIEIRFGIFFWRPDGLSSINLDAIIFVLIENIFCRETLETVQAEPLFSLCFVWLSMNLLKSLIKI